MGYNLTHLKKNGEKMEIKNYIFGALIACNWAMPLIGIRVSNTTEKTVYITATLPKKPIATTITMQPNGRETLELKENVTEIDLTVGTVIPSRRQMTIIEPLKGSRGWLYIGRDKEGHALYTPLFTRSPLEKPVEGASVSYAAIDGEITRVDSFPEEKNLITQQRYTLRPAAYAEDIAPQSHMMVVQDKKLLVKLYAPLVARSAAAQWYKNKQ